MNAAIDFGTWNTVVNVSFHGNDNILSDRDGNHFFPSVVEFKGQNDLSFGFSALHNYWMKENVIRFVKRVMGLPMNSDDLRMYQDECTTKIFAGPDGFPRFDISFFRPEGISPTEVISRFYRFIGKRIHEIYDTPIENLILTIPAFYTQDQRNETMKAAEQAGIAKKVHLVGEPVAAAYYHHTENYDPSRVILVLDIGAGTFDICLMRNENGEMQAIGQGGRRRLGGEDITTLLCSWAEQEFEKHYRRRLIAFPPKSRLYRKKKEALRTLVEEAKCNLSRSSSTTIRIKAGDFIVNYKAPADSGDYDYMDDDEEDEEFDLTLTLEEARRVVDGFLQDVKTSILNTLTGNNVQKESISEVILVGGCSHFIPFQEVAREIFGDHKVRQSDKPEEVVARGALRVLEKSILTGEHRLIQQLTHSYGTLLNDGSFAEIIPSRTTFPTNQVFSKKLYQVPTRDGLYPAAMVGVYVRDDINGGGPQEYNPFTVTNLSTDPRNEVDVIFTIDDNGVIFAEVRQKMGNPVVMPKTEMRRAVEFN